MSRGSTWGDEEIRFLIEIWSDDYIKTQLEKTHKNNETFNLFSERMRERGFNRTGEECHLKVKKLRQHYMRTRDASVSYSPLFHLQCETKTNRTKCMQCNKIRTLVRTIRCEIALTVNGEHIRCNARSQLF